jgi:hypothetical protein
VEFGKLEDNEKEKWGREENVGYDAEIKRNCEDRGGRCRETEAQDRR